VEKHCPKPVAPSLKDTDCLRYASLKDSKAVKPFACSGEERFCPCRTVQRWVSKGQRLTRLQQQSQPELWAKVFPLAFSISIYFGVTTVALMVACSRRIRASLANRVHLNSH
jgi:hypothetical protein